ncbi:UdgX family uracil-DNA binding protein [Sphingomonas sp. CGMCC 1.13654]|uniref:Type-4 uracil-DNA glycosylase n=1 Tax=Sphingomonas chungangi TaxID=2683589 RepID=A0A838KZZ4_9SPHN|nr:UdgX family uracil-DNA binding protein [Sphingomonas chungangi]MBA2932823.1 UdgX family uracil-DNA binding protein [Sphingomonas chungangi]MVW56445.1 UdgX family uracil-DNA binding protein [Sphingomonas chungangi]
MALARLEAEDDFEDWRTAARTAALLDIPPEGLHWQVGDQLADLFAGSTEPPLPPAPAGAAFSVPRPFVTLAETVILHHDSERFNLLYTMLLRLRDEPRRIEDETDPLHRRLEEMAKAVRRDIHKMRAFLRFREVADDDGQPRFVAWFEPEHHIVRANAGFFQRRFASMRWSILTPEISIHWDGDALAQGPGATREDAPDGDPTEEVWKTYYASIFNPARLKTHAMLKEMPKKYWKNMPETALVPDLIAGAQAREAAMVATQAKRTGPGGNAEGALAALREEAAHCRRCPLWKPATQTVFGEGPADAALLFIGEQPGDQEDLAGKPFVGPAGQLFDRALAEAGVDRARAYVSNAVKHFKFEPRGKRRIHSKPNAGEIEACRWWIDQERAIVRPKVTVALGATAAHSLLGKSVTISKLRGEPIALADGSEGWVTVHPSFLLRLPDEERKAEEYARFVEDLRRVGERAKALAG